SSKMGMVRVIGGMAAIPMAMPTTIEKHRPYPDTVYILNSNNLTFQFSIQGKDTASMPGSYNGLTGLKARSLGCCYASYDNNCYKNALQSDCRLKNGSYDPNPACTCPEPELKSSMSGAYTGAYNGDYNDDNPADAKTGDDCFIDEYGNIKKHGESWCEYQGIAGYGFDNVGSRHILKYCINGEIYTEECRDYREELCAEDIIIEGNTSYSHAMCRPNRWQDCTRCTTEECCENSEYRDCQWVSQATEASICIPYVPIGFRFWENSGREVCSVATVEKSCTGLSCGSTWLSQASKNCYMQGDCGNYWNTEGKVTYEGFFHTDIFSSTDISAYDIIKQAETVGNSKPYPDSAAEPCIGKGADNRKQAELMGSRLQPAVDNFAAIMASAYSIFGTISGMSASAHVAGINSSEVMEVAVCEPWKAPKGDDYCKICDEKAGIPCSEYRCRSLGRGCIFEEVNGTPICREIEEEKSNEKLEIFPDITQLQEGYSLEDEELSFGGKTYKGYRITPEIRPYSRFSIAVNTSRKSICRINFAPKAEIMTISGYYFGEPVYSTSHTQTARIPARPELPESLMDILNTSSMSGFSDAFKALSLGTGDSMAGDIDDNFFSRLFRKLTGKSIRKTIKPVSERIFNLFMLLNTETEFYKDVSEKVFERYEQGGYFMFIYCEDSSGKAAEEPIFFEMTISNNTDDDRPPELIYAYPENSSRFAADAESFELQLYLDEPAECRYSTNDTMYDMMEESFLCAKSRYDLSPRFGGSYVCSSTIDVKETDVKEIYIRCMDNPKQSVSYGLAFNMSNKSNEHLGIRHNNTRYLSISEGLHHINITAAGFIFEESTAGSWAIYAGGEVDGEGYGKVEGYREEDGEGYGEGDAGGEEGYAGGEEGYASGEEGYAGGEEGYAGGSGKQMPYSNAYHMIDICANTSTVFLELHIDKDMLCSADYTPGRKAYGSCNRSGDPELGVYSCSFELDLSPLKKINYSLTAAQKNKTGNGTTEAGDDPSVEDGTSGLKTADDNPAAGDKDSVFMVNIFCEEKGSVKHNKNTKSKVYTISRSGQLEITDYGPVGEIEKSSQIIYVDTTESNDIICGYYRELDLGLAMMDSIGNNRHAAEIQRGDLKDGKNDYYVSCTDSYGNSAEQLVRFYVVG
ncbi:hypothetical protein JXB31_05550, partial [Candidatus Woesearchaeota archaeon]|nr:hypothetical protein [Candidatus Woesearchaeota archaeon]